MPTDAGFVAILNEKNKVRLKALKVKQDIENARILLKKKDEDIENAKKQAILEQEEKLKADRIAQEIAEKEREIKRKTKQYFKLNKYNRKVQLEENTVYFGEHVGSHDAWIPHGHGEYLVGDTLIYEGNFQNGLPHGNMIYELDDGSKWEGPFINGNMDGVGVLTSRKGEKKNVLVRRNIIICDKNELIMGKVVEVRDSKYSVVAIRVVIIAPIDGWRFYVRMHDEVTPREREMDFSLYKDVKVLHTLPQVYHLPERDAKSSYDYFKDCYGEAGRPRLGVAGGRMNTERTLTIGCRALPVIERSRSDHLENLFESAVAGMSSAIEEEKERRKKDNAAKQWKELIEKRRKDEAAALAKRLEEEQQAYLQEQIDRHRLEDAARKKEDEDARQRELDETDRQTAYMREAEERLALKEREELAKQKGLIAVFTQGALCFDSLRGEDIRVHGWTAAQSLYLVISMGKDSTKSQSVADDGLGNCTWPKESLEGKQLQIKVTAQDIDNDSLKIQVWDSPHGQTKAKDMLLCEGSLSLAGIADMRKDEIVIKLFEIPKKILMKNTNKNIAPSTASTSVTSMGRIFASISLTDTSNEVPIIENIST